MSAHNSSVDHHVFVIGVARQQPENPLKNPALRPSAETLMHALPIAEARRQIAPRNTGSEPVQKGFNKQPVIRRRASDMAFATRQNILDPIPYVSQSAPSVGPPQTDLPGVRQLLNRESSIVSHRQQKTMFLKRFRSVPVSIQYHPAPAKWNQARPN